FQYPVVLTRAAWERCVVIPPRLLCGSAVERAFSPDGRFLAVWYSVWASKHPLEVWDLKPGVSRPLIALDDAATAPEFSPDGRTIAVGSRTTRCACSTWPPAGRPAAWPPASRRRG